MSVKTKSKNSSTETEVDEQIYRCLDLENPKSFFLFAGAGSGKTRSLVNVLERVKLDQGSEFSISGKRVAIITYTNAASEEIVNRLENDPIFKVSTIHSFVWDLIKNYSSDIKVWLQNRIKTDNIELQDLLSTGKAGTKIAIDRANKIESNNLRLEKLKTVTRFTYNPNGENRSKDSLNHPEVISIAADFLLRKPLFQQVFVSRYPILLVDESQDTKKDLIEAFFSIQEKYADQFTLGLFGDTMQRIYADGKENLGLSLPSSWEQPAKIINHRCPKRIVRLINKIRFDVDGQQQVSPENKEEGFLRFFIVPNNVDGKDKIEELICERMAEITKDPMWKNVKEDVKTLTLEHHMAARRMGFLQLFEPIYKSDRLKTGLLDGSLPGLRLFTQIILPLVVAKKSGDEFAIARIVRKYSPFFDRENFIKTEDQTAILHAANKSVASLFELWENNTDPKLISILTNIYETKLFDIPGSLNIIAKRADSKLEIISQTSDEELDDVEDDVIVAWDAALESPFSQIEKYYNYIEDKASYGTHQGVKGLQFPRVLIVLDDEEARGFLFSFDKILGLKAPSETDVKNMRENRDTSIQRTLRLFYVACSRAQKSLAIVGYASSPEIVQKHIQEIGWVTADEIEIVGKAG